MKKWVSLYDLCPVGLGTRNDGTVRITAMAYLKNCPDNAWQMEKQLLRTSEYILIRGKNGGGYGGLLREINVFVASKITGQAITALYTSVPKVYRQNAVFLMNAVTLNELRCALNADAHDWITSKRDGPLLLMDKPVMLCHAMPFVRKGSVPILFGDFSKVSIKDCGRDEMHQEPCNGNPDGLVCTRNPATGTPTGWYAPGTLQREPRRAGMYHDRLYELRVGGQTGYLGTEDHLRRFPHTIHENNRGGRMTNGEKMLIAQQIKQGMGYSEIARKLCMSVNTVKSYCQRNGLKRAGKSVTSTNDVCRRCGCALEHTPGRKKKQFCSDACRLRWWHEHRYMSKTARSAKCAACGRAFMTDRGQRYCSHACYIHMRFGGNRGNGTQQAQ